MNLTDHNCCIDIAEGEVNNLQWSATQPDWVSIAFNDKLQICTYSVYVYVCMVPQGDPAPFYTCALHTRQTHNSFYFILFVQCVYKGSIICSKYVNVLSTINSNDFSCLHAS